MKKSLVIVGVVSVIMFVLGEGLARPLSSIFVGYNAELFNMTLRGFFIYSFSFLFAGLAIFAYFGCRYLTKYSILLTKKLCKSIVVINKEEVVK